MATKESLFIFDGDCYKEIDGVAMGSPLGPTLANAFLCFYESKWLSECSLEFKPLYYRRYVDAVFVHFSSPDHLTQFKDYLNSRHDNISFPSEIENDGTLPFLDIKIERDGNNFVTSVYRKSTFSGVYSHLNSLYLFHINKVYYQP